jgi:hypothetical protein
MRLVPGLALAPLFAVSFVPLAAAFIVSTPVPAGIPAVAQPLGAEVGYTTQNPDDCLGGETGSDVWGQNNNLFCTFRTDKTVLSEVILARDVGALATVLPVTVDTFLGIRVHYLRKAANGNNCFETTLQLRYNGEYIFSNQALATVWTQGNFEERQVLISENIPRATALHASFGVALRVSSANGGVQGCYVNAIRIELIYDDGLKPTTGVETTGTPGAMTTGIPTVPATAAPGASTTGFVVSTTTGLTTAKSTSVPSNKAGEDAGSEESGTPILVWALIGVLAACMLCIAAAALVRHRRRAQRKGGSQSDELEGATGNESSSGGSPEERESAYAKTPGFACSPQEESAYAKTPASKTPDLPAPEAEPAYAKTPASRKKREAYAKTPASL